MGDLIGYQYGHGWCHRSCLRHLATAWTGPPGFRMSQFFPQELALTKPVAHAEFVFEPFFNGLLDRQDGMQILTGPARSGKTGRLLELYAAALERARKHAEPGRTLWIAPTRLVVSQLTQTLSARLQQVLIAPNVMTFEGFAESILQRSSQILRPVPPMLQRSLLQRISRELLGSGTLRNYQSIAHTSGFLDLVQHLIAELKREERWPEVFADACQKRGLRNSDQDLLDYYQRYQTALLNSNRYDQEGRFWGAYQVLPHLFGAAETRYDLIVIDGFSDFTHTQYDWIRWLSEHAADLWISLQADAADVPPESRRGDLFDKPQRVLERLRALVPEVRVQQAETAKSAASRGRPRKSAEPPRDPFQHIARSLFSNPRQIVLQSHAAGLKVISATGIQGEVRAIAVEIKRLLQSGVRPSEIVVATRSVDDYGPLIRDLFTAAGIPQHCETQPMLMAHPLLRGVLSLLQLELSDWSFERLRGLLTASWLQPDWQGWSSRHIPALLHTIREAQLPAGKWALRGVLRAALQRNPALEPARKMLDALGDLLSPWERSQTWNQWADSLLTVCRELGLAPRRETALAGELEVWNAFEESLRIAAETERLFEFTPEPLSLAEFTAELTSLLQRHPCPQPQRPATAVSVLDAAQVRGLDVPYLFLIGLNERSFPARGSEAALYTESERQELNAHGLRFSMRSQQLAAEMLLFYAIVTRATRQLTLTYPAISPSGQPLSPSPYLQTLLELFTPGSVLCELREEFDPVPAFDHALTPADWRVVATALALEGDTDSFATLAAEPTSFPVALSIAGAAEMAWNRFHRRGFTPYEGNLELPLNRNRLARMFSREQQFSPSQLEAYAQCPFRFFARQVLQLEPLEDPEAGTDHARRGDLVHQALAELHQMLIDQPQVSPTEISAQFQERIGQILRQQATNSPLQAALLEIEQALLHEWADYYGLHWSVYQNILHKQIQARLEPRFFELSFGRPHGSEEAGEFPPLHLGTGDDLIQIRGRIDRVDVAITAEQTFFTVLDYKTGREPKATKRDLIAGRSLQLLLYSLAVQRLNLAGNETLPLAPGYWCLKEEGYTPLSLKVLESGEQGWQSAPAWNELIEHLEQLLPQFAAGMRRGEFPVYNSDQNCTAYCPYKTTCRVAQVRPLADLLDKTWGEDACL